MSSSIRIKTDTLANTDPAIRTKERQRTLRLWRDYIWPQKTRFITAMIFMVILAAGTAAYLWVVNELFDQFNNLGEGDAVKEASSYAKKILPILLGLPLIVGIANYAQQILCNAIALNAVGEMQKQMFAAAHKADYASFGRRPTGTLMSKFISDVTVISGAINALISNLVRDILTVIFVIGGMFWLNWKLSLAMLLFGLAFWPITIISKKIRGSAHDVQEHIGIMTSELKESFTGARMIKTYGLEDREEARLGKSFDERIRLYLKMITEKARVDPILEVLGGLVFAAAAIAGAYIVKSGIGTIGSIAAVLVGVFTLSPRLRSLGALNNVFQEGHSSLTRIFDVIDEKPEIIDAPNAVNLKRAKGHVALENVSFSYEDGTEALSGVSLEARPGEMIALVGESGGGKSTIVNLIPRLYDVREGSISIDETDIRNYTIKSLRSQLALVSQDVTLFNDSVAANIGYGRLDASQADIEAAAKAAAAYDFIMALPAGFDTVIGEDGDTLSGGQKQRLAIARAILRDAPILLLDEATSALDAESEVKVQSAVEALGQGRTQIVIAHRLSTVKKADRIYVLEKGQVVETGTHTSLSKKKNGVYARLKSLQMDG